MMNKWIPISLGLGLALCYLLVVAGLGITHGIFKLNASVISKLKDTTVIVYTEHGTRGSGFITKSLFNDEYYVVTNAHVCAADDWNKKLMEELQNMENVDVGVNYRIKNRKVSMKATFKRIDVRNDVCLLGIKDYRGDYLTFEDEKITNFDIVFLSTHHPEKKNVFFTNAGYVTDSLEVFPMHEHSYTTTMQVVSGMSGSPIVNFQGNIIGIIWGTSKSHKTMGFAVRKEVIQELIKKYEAKKLSIH